MHVTLTAVGPDHRGLADSILHHVTAAGASIAEVQTYDHSRQRLFSILLRMEWPASAVSLAELRARMHVIGRDRGLSIRVWSPEEHATPPRLVLCLTHRRAPARAVLEAARRGTLKASVVALVANRPTCQDLAAEFGVDWHLVAGPDGVPDDGLLLSLFDRYLADYVVLARYARMVPPNVCWAFGGGRIVNLHPGLLPPSPGANPYREAASRRMLVFGATVHYVTPDLGLGGQIVHQDTFSVRPGTPIEEVIRRGESEHEPACLVEGLRRVVHREVELRFHKVAARG